MNMFSRWCCVGALIAGTAQAQTTTRVNLSSNGDVTNAEMPTISYLSSISADGTHVVFGSAATTMVPNDTNGCDDVFVRDLTTNTTVRASVSSSGVEGNGASRRASISANGRYVAFHSDASNLVPNDTNQNSDVFVRDIVAGTTRRVSVRSNGVQANNHSMNPAISLDGRYVAFGSTASNLFPGDTNGYGDIYVHDLQTAQTRRVSVSSTGAQGNAHAHIPAISGNGRFVLFGSSASNLVPGDTNKMLDLFVHDRATGVTERVNVDSSGNQATYFTWPWGSISADGRYVAFQSWATNLDEDTNDWEDIFVHDRQTGRTRCVSVNSVGIQANDWNHEPHMSPDGRYVAFTSRGTNLIPDDTNGMWDCFLYDMWTRKTERVSLTAAGGEPQTGASVLPWLSYDARYVLFTSKASDLVLNDFGFGEDFVRDRGTTHFESFCFGDGSLGAQCPCAAPDVVPAPSGGYGHGCANSFSLDGAQLYAAGPLAPDHVVFDADIAPNYIGFAFLVKANAQFTFGIPNGDGVRCVSGAFVRFGGHAAGTNGSQIGWWRYPNDVQTIPVGTITGQLPGGTAYYQLGYRNSVLGFCTPNTTNWSNALRVSWPP